MSSKRRRHTSESSDIINEDDSDDGGSVKSGFSAFLHGLSKKRGTRNVNSRLVCCNVRLAKLFATKRFFDRLHPQSQNDCSYDFFEFRSLGGSQQPSPKRGGSSSTAVGGGRSISVAASPSLSRKTSSGSTGMRDDYKRHKRAASLRSRFTAVKTL